MIKEVKVLSIHYKHLNMKCAWAHLDGGCDGEVSIIRISAASDGELYVSTMCKKHADKEKERALEDGFLPRGQTSIAGAFSDAVLVAPDFKEERELVWKHLRNK